MTNYAVPNTAPSPARHRIARYLATVILIVLVAGYALVIFLTRSIWADPPPQTRVSATFSAHTSDGSPPSPKAMGQAGEVLAKRVTALGMVDVETRVDGDEVAVTATGSDYGALREIGDIGRLDMRPVIHEIPIPTPDAPPSPPRTGPNSDLAQRIAEEKEARQSSDQNVQVLALQFQATRCNQDDVLAGNDDPNLPLVTCSSDNSRVYLLDRSILSEGQITNAAQVDDLSSSDTVEVTFGDAGARILAGFSEANIGKPVAYTLDTEVLSAPEIMEADPGGRATITGLTPIGQARILAATLSGGPLPVELSSQLAATEQVAVETGSTAHRVGVLAGAIVVGLVVASGTTYLVLSGVRRRRAAP
ncbi:MAG: hypothetical protein U0R81_15120 [Mycobacterium sp.]